MSEPYIITRFVVFITILIIQFLLYIFILYKKNKKISCLINQNDKLYKGILYSVPDKVFEVLLCEKNKFGSFYIIYKTDEFDFKTFKYNKFIEKNKKFIFMKNHQTGEYFLEEIKN